MKYINYPLIALIITVLVFLPGCKVKRRPSPATVNSDLSHASSEKREQGKAGKVSKRPKRSKKLIKPKEGTPASVEADATWLDITGSRWTIIYEEPEIGAREYDLIFRRGGKLENFHPNESTSGDDSWEQRGESVILYFNNRFATYEGVMTDENVMSGTAKSRIGLEWKWKAYQKK